MKNIFNKIYNTLINRKPIAHILDTHVENIIPYTIGDKLITFETAKLAKEKGFSLPISSDNKYFNDNGNVHIWGWFHPLELADPIDAVSQSLLQRWLREVHNIQVVMKPVLGSKNGYDSYPMIGWDFDIIKLNKNSNNSYYMGYPIGDWFTGIVEDDETLEELGINPNLSYEESLEIGLQKGLKYVVIK